MTTNANDVDERKRTDKPAVHQGDHDRPAAVEESGDNRSAEDVDGNKGAGSAKSPGAKSPEVE